MEQYDEHPGGALMVLDCLAQLIVNSRQGRKYSITVSSANPMKIANHMSNVCFPMGNENNQSWHGSKSNSLSQGGSLFLLSCAHNHKPYATGKKVTDIIIPQVTGPHVHSTPTFAFIQGQYTSVV